MEKEKESSAPVFGLNNPFNDLCGLEIAEQRSGQATAPLSAATGKGISITTAPSTAGCSSR